MNKHQQFSLSLIFKLLLVANIFFIGQADADNKRKFGNFGHTGSDGEAGQNGTPGRDLVAKADGSQLDFNLSGTDGSYGQRGEDGGDASGCTQPNRPNRNLRAASGGDGGDGGRGGKGGDAGNLVLLYSQLDDLKKIRVLARGGRGGQGGSGGRGGRYCSCYESHWTVRECKDEKQSDGSSRRVCKNHPKSCVDGRGGKGGSHGKRGNDGEDGSLYLVQGVKNWKKAVLSKTVPIEKAHNTKQTLTEHIFLEDSGAANYLASGSYVSDTFYQYQETEKVSTTLKWASKRPVNELAGLELELVKEESEIVYKADGALIKIEEQGDVTNVMHVVPEIEAKQLNFSVTTEGPNSKIILEDFSQWNDALKDKITIKVATKRLLFGWKKAVERELKLEEMPKKDGVYEISLKGLGIKEKFLKSGKKLKIELKVLRELGNDSVNVEFSEKVKV